MQRYCFSRETNVTSLIEFIRNRLPVKSYYARLITDATVLHFCERKHITNPGRKIVFSILRQSLFFDRMRIVYFVKLEFGSLILRHPHNPRVFVDKKVCKRSKIIFVVIIFRV